MHQFTLLVSGIIQDNGNGQIAASLGYLYQEFTNAEKGKQIGARLELSRTYYEVGKRLTEPNSKFNALNGISADQYLKKAKEMFKEMDLQMDLDELERIDAYR